MIYVVAFNTKIFKILKGYISIYIKNTYERIKSNNTTKNFLLVIFLITINLGLAVKLYW